jgi:dTDP-D-glucose 4,6-dehydratase
MRKKISKILITGGAGFMGSEFTREAVRRGYKVIVVDKLTYAGDLARLKEIKGKYKFYRVDICNKKQIDSIFNRERPDVVLNFAAQTHVDRSIQDAAPFIETNIKGTQILLDAAGKHRIEKFIHVSCYDEKTRALTTEGLKTHEELKGGDKVFSLNPKTQKIEIKPIEKIIIQHYKGEMIHFKNKRIDLLVTPNHRMFILNTSKKNRKLIVETAEKASQRSIFYMPEGYWVGKNKEYIDIKGFGRVKTTDLMYILGIFIGDGFIAYQEKQIETKTGLARKEYLEKSKDSKTGRFIKIKKFSNYISTSHGYRIFFDIPENDKCRKKVEETLRSLGIKYHYHKGKAGTHLYFTSKIFMDLFAQCEQGAHNKCIPRWVLDYSSEYLSYLLKGLMDSDGHDGRIYHTVSERLLSDICELCIKLNLKPSIHKRKTLSFVNGRKIQGETSYIFVAKTTKSISRHRNKIINYNGDIWCVKVKDNKNLLVERNGYFDFCGNTDEVYGEIKKGKFLENSPLRPNSPYAASKAAADLLVKAYIRTYDFPAIIIRPCNNYGPWQYPEKLISLTILKALKNERVPVYKRGKNIREWLYVSDCIKAIFLILEKGKLGEIYNVGSGQERRNIDVVKQILKILGKSESLIEFVKDRPGHDFRYSLNTQKVKKEFGWQAKTKFAPGLKKTTRWYILNKNWLGFSGR